MKSLGAKFNCTTTNLGVLILFTTVLALSSPSISISKNPKNPKNCKKSQKFQINSTKKKENSKNPKPVHHFRRSDVSLGLSRDPSGQELSGCLIVLGDKIAEDLITRKMSFLEPLSLRSTVDVYFFPSIESFIVE